MGQNSFVASIAEKQAYGNVIQYQDGNEKIMKVDMTGIPALAGVWVEVGGPGTETKDAKGLPIIDRIWWDEENMKLMRTIMAPEGVADSVDATQTREITADDKLVATVSVRRRSDNATCAFKAIFKRVSD